MIKIIIKNQNPKVYPLYSEPTPNPASSSSTIYHILPTTYSKAFTPLRPRLRRVKVASPAFTIVELLVTIAVIGILVSITVVSYTAIITRVASETLKQDLNEGASQLKKYYYDHGAYPASLTNNCPSSDASDAVYCLKPSSGDSYSYTSSSPNSIYCLSSTKSSQSYFVTQAGTQLAGPCPVLYLDAGITASYPGAGTTWTDLSGNSNNGTLVGGLGVAGLGYSSTNGGSLTFDGSNDYAEVVSNNSLNPTNQITVEMWFQPNETMVTWQAVLGKGGGSAFEKGYEFAVSAGQFGFWVNGNSHFVKTTMPISGEMAYWVGTFDGTSLKLYKNNNLVDTISYTSTIISTTLPFRVSAVSEAGGNKNYTAGKYYGVRVYNRALTSTEITQNYNTLKGRYGL